MVSGGSDDGGNSAPADERVTTSEDPHLEPLQGVLGNAVSRLNDMVVITEADPVGAPGPRVVYVNDAFERCSGYSFNEIVGKTPRILQGPGTQRRELDRIRAALTQSLPVHAELINYKKSGEEYWLDVDISPFADSSGVNRYFIAIERDITDQKKTESILRQQAALLDQAQDAIIVRGLDHRVQYWNKSAERIYGWSSDQVMGLSIEDLTYQHDTSVFRKAMDAVLKTGEWAGEIVQSCRDGRKITVRAKWTLVRDSDGNPKSILVINTDITESLAVAEQLQQSQRLEAIGHLTGGVAHDFNNLLTVILGNAEIMTLKLADDDPLRPLAEMTEKAAQRGAELTNRLLTFARRQALNPQNLNANRLIDGMVSLLRRTIDEHIDINIKPEPMLREALADAGQLESAILNLCINARDAMKAGGRLEIETANVTLDAAYADKHGDVTPGQFVMIAVSDTGDGMSPEVAAQAFDPFFTTKPMGAGSGLGLSMVYGFARQSNGHVKISYSQGVGTTVRLYLPRSSSIEDSRDDEDHPSDLTGGPETILLVEDDDLVRTHVVGQLTAMGYGVVSASSGAEALALLEAGAAPDLLFTDIIMPGAMNGRELAEAARRSRPGLPVLFTSGYAETVLLHHGRLDREINFLSKPYRLQDLARSVRQALG